MNKIRIKGFLICIGAVAALFFALIWNSTHTIMGMTIIGANQAKQWAEKAVTLTDVELLWNDIPIPFAEIDGAFYLPVDSAERWQGRITASDEGKLFIAQTDDKSKNELVASGEAVQVFYKYNDTLMQAPLYFCGGALICLDTEKIEPGDEEGRELNTGSFLLWNRFDEEQYYNSRAVWHMRGNMAALADKQSYRLTLLDTEGNKIDQSLLGMREDDDWILNAMSTDATLAREKTAYALWDRMARLYEWDLPSVCIEYAELVLNGEYRGLYGLSYPVQKKTVGFEEEDRMFKWRAPVLPWNNYAMNILDGKEEMEWEGTVRIEWPKEWYSGVWSPLQDYANFFFLHEKKGSWADLNCYTDINNMLDIILFKQLLACTDNRFNNIFYVWKADTGRILRIPWDLDSIWDSGGRLPAGEELLYGFVSDFEWETMQSMDPDETYRLLSLRWQLLRQDGLFNADLLAENIRSSISSMKEHGAWQRNWTKWAKPDNSLEEENCIRFIHDRISWLDRYFNYSEKNAAA